MTPNRAKVLNTKIKSNIKQTDKTSQKLISKPPEFQVDQARETL